MSKVLFREEQWFPRFIGAVVGGVAAATAVALITTRSVRTPWMRKLLAGTGGLLGLTGATSPMRTTVTEEGVTITFGLPGWLRFAIAAEEIESAEPVTYKPLKEFWGWGIRIGLDGTRAYTALGSRGVRIYTERRSFLIGSQRSEELAEALQKISARASSAHAAARAEGEPE